MMILRLAVVSLTDTKLSVLDKTLKEYHLETAVGLATRLAVVSILFFYVLQKRFVKSNGCNVIRHYSAFVMAMVRSVGIEHCIGVVDLLCGRQS